MEPRIQSGAGRDTLQCERMGRIDPPLFRRLNVRITEGHRIRVKQTHLSSCPTPTGMHPALPLLWTFVLAFLNVLRGLVPAATLFQPFTYAIGCFSVVSGASGSANYRLNTHYQQTLRPWIARQ